MPSRTGEKPRSYETVLQECPIIHWLLRINPLFSPEFIPISIGQGRLVDVSPDSSLSQRDSQPQLTPRPNREFPSQRSLKKLPDKFRYKVINVLKCGFLFMYKLGSTTDLETTPVKFHYQQSTCSVPVWGRAGQAWTTQVFVFSCYKPNAFPSLRAWEIANFTNNIHIVPQQPTENI